MSDDSSADVGATLSRRGRWSLAEILFWLFALATLFLLPELNVKLLPKLLRDLKPGTRIVSNTFDMGDWQPAKEVTVGDPEDHPFSHRLYLWIVPPPPVK